MVEESTFTHIGAEAGQIVAKAFARSSLKAKASYGNSRLEKPVAHDNENRKATPRTVKSAARA